MRTIRIPQHTRQQGAILLISLIMLLLLTIIGVAAMNTATLEERMAGNLRDANLAFQGAEAALRDGEAFLDPLITEPAVCKGKGCRIWDSAALEALLENKRPLEEQTAEWWETLGEEYGANGTRELAGHADPHSIIELHDFVRDSLTVGHTGPETGRVFYRVTARSEGGSDTAVSVLQTSYVKRYN